MTVTKPKPINGNCSLASGKLYVSLNYWIFVRNLIFILKYINTLLCYFRRFPVWVLPGRHFHIFTLQGGEEGSKNIFISLDKCVLRFGYLKLSVQSQNSVLHKYINNFCRITVPLMFGGQFLQITYHSYLFNWTEVTGSTLKHSYKLNK